jgi:RNA polymerase sigma-70 factor (sigma-E family)
VPERDEFQEFVVASRTRLLRTAWLLTGDWHAAEDLVQTALIKCYPHWQRITSDQPEAYVRKAVFSAYASSWRRRWRGEVPTASLPESSGDHDEYAAVNERAILVAALGKLPPRQRATLVLRYFEDLSEADTAVALGCSVGTVKSQTAKALSQLRTSGVLLDRATRDEVARD